MSKISTSDFEKIMHFNINDNACIEINFCVDASEVYTSCWLGKLISEEKKEVYWFGLTADGSEAYDFDSVRQLLETKVFNGKSLKKIWELITIISIDGCDVEDRISYYSGEQTVESSRARSSHQGDRKPSTV